VLARTDRSAPTLEGVHDGQVRGDPIEPVGSTDKGRKIFRQSEQRKALNMNPADRMGVAESSRTCLTLRASVFLSNTKVTSCVGLK
jgi:hypothetical protein